AGSEPRRPSWGHRSSADAAAFDDRIHGPQGTTGGPVEGGGGRWREDVADEVPVEGDVVTGLRARPPSLHRARRSVGAPRTRRPSWWRSGVASTVTDSPSTSTTRAGVGPHLSRMRSGSATHPHPRSPSHRQTAETGEPWG